MAAMARQKLQSRLSRRHVVQGAVGGAAGMALGASRPQGVHAQAAAFPSEFVWGAATSAYQVEGAVKEDGRGPSIWDVFSHTPGKTANGDTGDVADDHYHRYRDDIALMRELGLKAYRFSVAWPRIYPTGSGQRNEAGLDFYRRLLDELHAAGITPYLTLYHWDLPQTLEELGGWGNRDTAKRFGEYAHTVATAFGADVHHWFTINEPWVIAFLGYFTGLFAPGERDLALALRAAHNILLAHGEGMNALRAEMAPGDEAGIVLNLSPCEPASDASGDLAATIRFDGYLNRWFLDPVFRGSYPEDMVQLYGEAMPEITPGDMELIAQPTDIFGFNYYNRSLVADDPTDLPIQAKTVVPPGAPVTAMGWEVYPQGLYDLLQRIHHDYGPARMLVTENGAAYDDVVIDGQVDDSERESYLHEHLLKAHQAIEDGVPLAGYFVWSLLDNFEWASGYGKRFGIIHVDFATQERIIKRSGRWYADVIAANSISG
jgi:beta-glucosidase